MNYKNKLIEKLKKYKKKDIVITKHAEFQAIFRSVEIEEVKQNILNPKKLAFAGKQEANKEDEEKYDCYFGYSKTQCHRYVLVLSAKCVVCTIIKINRRWQRMVEKYAKI